MKKEERESQIVRSPKSTNLFHLLSVLLTGTVSNRSLSLSICPFINVFLSTPAIPSCCDPRPRARLDSHQSSLSLGHPSHRRDFELSAGKPSPTSYASPLACHLRRSPPDLSQVIFSHLSHLTSYWVFFFVYTAESVGKPRPQRQRYQK